MEQKMPPKSGLEAIQLRLEKQAAKLHTSASNLSSRIEAFEQWLTSLDAQVSAAIEYEDQGAKSILFLQRDGKEWRLKFARYSGVAKCFPPGDALVRQSLETKIDAVKRLPQLLEVLSGKQELRIASLQEAHGVLDHLLTGPMKTESA